MPAFGDYKKNAKISMFATTIETILELIVPTIMALIIDRAVSRKDIKMTVILGGLMILVSLLCMYTGMLATKHASATSSGIFGSEIYYKNFSYGHCCSNFISKSFTKTFTFIFGDLATFACSNIFYYVQSNSWI